MRFLCQISFLLISPLFFAQDYAAGTIPDQLMANANAVVRLNEKSVVVLRQDLMQVSSKRVVTVLNGQGEQYIQAYLFYDKNVKIGTLEARIFDKYGKEIKRIKQKDFFDQSAVGGGTLYSDNRIRYLRYTPTQYPYTVELTNVYTTSNTAFGPSWNFLDGYRVSTEKSHFTFRVECGIPFRLKESNLGTYKIEKNIADNQVEYIGVNLEAIESEPLSPLFSEFVPNIKTSLDKFHLEGVDGVATNWEEFGKWIYDKLLMGNDFLNPMTIENIGELVKDIEDPYEKVKMIYEYVQNNTRYISVQLGIGGWMPISAEEVDRVKYGDCKGLTNYTMALLKAVGIKSFYTVLYAGEQRRDMDSDFTSMQGNHAFLNIPLESGDIWLECTSQITPVNHLGTFSDDRMVLKITSKGGQIVKTKSYADEENYQLLTAEYFTEASGKVFGKVSILSRGIQYDRKFRQPAKSKLDQEKYYKQNWNYLSHLTLDNINYKNDKKKIEFVEEIEIVAENYLSEAGGKLLFAPNLTNRNLTIPERCRNRKRDLIISRGQLEEDEIIIHLPEGYISETLFAPNELKSKFGSYKMEIVQKEPGVLIYNRRLLVKSGEYPKEDYEKYRSFRKQVARYDNSRIVLTKI